MHEAGLLQCEDRYFFEHLVRCARMLEDHIRRAAVDPEPDVVLRGWRAPIILPNDLDERFQ